MLLYLEGCFADSGFCFDPPLAHPAFMPITDEYQKYIAGNTDCLPAVRGSVSRLFHVTE